MKKTLYVYRPLLNGKDFFKWAKKQGFKNILEPKDLHVTIAFSKKDVDWSKIEPKTNSLKISGGNRVVAPLGNEGAIVLKFQSQKLSENWQYYINKGASWDWESYQPHISITYDGSDLPLNKIKPFSGELIFGPEKMKELDLDWKSKIKTEN